MPTLLGGGDPRDFTDQYNTQLDEAQEAEFKVWAATNKREKDTYDYDLRGAYASGAAQSENGHLPDTFKKPNHPTFSDESQYHGADGKLGGTWKEVGKDKFEFHASESNLANMSEEELKAYFDKNEPDVKLVLPKRTKEARMFPSMPQ